MADERTIAEIWEEGGLAVGYVWVTFADVKDYNLTIAEVKDVAVTPDYQRRGIGLEMLEHVEQSARQRGARLLRSETGIDNVASQALHTKCGFTAHRIQYEKRLIDEPP